MDVAVVRKRIQKAIEQARRESADRRTRAQEAEKDYDEFLDSRAIPAFRSVAVVLKSEGLPWEVMTPSSEVRLVPGRRRDEYIAITFDATADPPQAMVSVTRGRGGRMLHSERPVKPGTPAVAQISEDDVVEMLIEELRPWLG
jgi:transcription elongation GreA/GreB family factor